jgi:hypothetical protein
MLKWAISVAINRLFIFALIWFAIKTYGPAVTPARR